jgi:hypothetical protein
MPRKTDGWRRRRRTWGEWFDLVATVVVIAIALLLVLGLALSARR